MIHISTINELKSLKDEIANGNIEYSLEILLNFSREYHIFNNFENTIINLSAELNSYLKEVEISIEKNDNISKIRKNVLTIIDKFIKISNKHFQSDNEFNLKNYLHKVISDFKHWQNKFVHINGKEKRYSNFLIYAKELNAGENKINREGTIIELIEKASIKENGMIITGEAGTGKTTTLQYLSFFLSKKLLKKEDYKIPIFIALNTLTDKNKTLEHEIFDNIGVSYVNGENHLINGDFFLLLDGLNEILKEHKNLRIQEIKNILSKYPKTFLVITSRPQDYSNEFAKIPLFSLQKLKENQISEFLNNNCSSSNVRDLIFSEIKNNERIHKIVKIPLILYMFINVVEKEKKIPETEKDIIKNFIYGLYYWQKQNDYIFDIEIFHNLLRYVGLVSFQKGQNASLKKGKLMQILKKRKNEFGYDIDLSFVIKKALELNILIENRNLFSFSHQIYQEYYVSEELSI